MKRHLKLLLAGLLLVFVAMVSVSTETPPAFIEMEVKGIRIDPVGQSPVVILVDKEGKKALPIWIGVVEAGAIERELTHVRTARPMTHDLFHSILGRVKVKVKEVKVVDLRDQTYYALLYLESNGDLIEVDARPSDAIILALKSNAPISVAAKIVEAQGVSLAQRSLFGERQGIRVQELTPALAAQFEFRGRKGVLVSDVTEGSPAAASGIKAGDIITRIDSKEISDVGEFERELDAHKEADSVKLSIFREDRFLEVELSLKP